MEAEEEEAGVKEGKNVESFLRRDAHTIRRYSYLSYLPSGLIKKIRYRITSP
jgi:hypothetical protein